MQQIKCPGCGTLVAVTPVPGQIMGCPNCRTPLTTSPAASPQGGASQGGAAPRAGEMAVNAAPPPPGSPQSAPPTMAAPATSPPGAAPVAGAPAMMPPGAPAATPPQMPPQIPTHAPSQAPAPIPGQAPSMTSPASVAPAGMPVRSVAAPATSVAPIAAAPLAAQDLAVSATPRSPNRNSRRASPVATLIPLFAFIGFLLLLAIGGIIWYALQDDGRPARSRSSTSVRDSNGSNSDDKFGKAVWKGAVVVPGAQPAYDVVGDGARNRVIGDDGFDPSNDRTLGWVKRGNVKVQLQSVEYEPPQGRDASNQKITLPKKCLIITLLIRNVGRTKLHYNSWRNAPYRAQLSGAPGTTRLVDDQGRAYAGEPFAGVVSIRGHVKSKDISENASITDSLLFDVGENTARGFQLSLPGAAVGQSGEFKFFLRRADRPAVVAPAVP